MVHVLLDGFIIIIYSNKAILSCQVGSHMGMRMFCRLSGESGDNATEKFVDFNFNI